MKFIWNEIKVRFYVFPCCDPNDPGCQKKGELKIIMKNNSAINCSLRIWLSAFRTLEFSNLEYIMICFLCALRSTSLSRTDTFPTLRTSFLIIAQDAWNGESEINFAHFLHQDQPLDSAHEHGDAFFCSSGRDLELSPFRSMGFRSSEEKSHGSFVKLSSFPLVTVPHGHLL